MKKYGVYHVFCKNDWKIVFQSQIQSLVNSGLLIKIEKLYLTIIYNNEEDLNFINSKINNLNIEIHYTTNKNDEYEFPALNLIKELSEKNDCYLFYIHTKGVSIDESNMKFYHNSVDLNHLKNCVDDWREYMEYFIIKNHELCINSLVNYDACGVNLVKEPTKHFSGNFWWAKSDYVKKLPNLNNLNKNHRWNAEFWIGMGNGKLYNFFKNNAGYTERLNKKDYLL